MELVNPLPKILRKTLGVLHVFAATLLQQFPFLSSLKDCVTGDNATFDRNSIATVITDSGVFTDLSSGQPPYTGSGIQIEPAHINMLLRSRDLTNASWTKLSATITANTNETTDPKGGNTAQKVFGSGPGDSTVLQNIAHGLSQPFMMGVIVKKGSLDYAALQVIDQNNTGSRAIYYFNLETGSVGSVSPVGSGFSGLSAKMTDLGNGWYYCQGKCSTSGITALRPVIFPSAINGTVSGTVGSHYYFYQADGQPSNYFASSILTTSTAATVLNSDLSIDLGNLPANDFYLEFDWTPIQSANGQYLLSFSSGANGIEVFVGASGIEANNTSVAVTITSGTTYKIRLTQSSTDGETLKVNTLTNNSASSTSDITWPSTGYLGSRHTGGNHTKGVVANLKVDSI